MSKFKSEFLKVIKERGFIYQCTDDAGLDNLFSNENPITAYIGFDCTAPSLHVGSLIQIMILRWFEKTGNKPLVLIGGATTKIGDPSGRDETRKILSEQDITIHIEGINKVFKKFEINTDTVNNEDWLSNINHLDFLKKYGRHFSINRMLSMESVKNRIDREQELSFLEFNYMTFQALDFVHLAENFDCRLQIGGSDQWGNIVSGIDLYRRLHQGDNQLYGLTTPLITTSSGVKMGKTADGAIWLDEEMLSSYDYWQFWRNTEDADVGKFLRLFTELPIDEIQKLEKLDGAEINEAKIILANEATKLCHGEDAAISSEETAQKTFRDGGAGDDLPTIEKSTGDIEKGLDYISLFVETGLSSSKKEARRLIEGGGAKVNDIKIESIESKTSKEDITTSDTIKLSAGKKKHALVKVV